MGDKKLVYFNIQLPYVADSLTVKLTAKAAAVPPIAMDWNRPGLTAAESDMFNSVVRSQLLESAELEERTTFLEEQRLSTYPPPTTHQSSIRFSLFARA